jgi:hypothetical protein
MPRRDDLSTPERWAASAEDEDRRPIYIVVRDRKSVGAAMGLAFLFGPLGLMYASVPAGVFMMFVSLAFWVVSFGAGGIGVVAAWPLCIIWAYVAATSYNRRIDDTMQERHEQHERGRYGQW